MTKSFLIKSENKYPVVSNTVHSLIDGILKPEKVKPYSFKTNKIEQDNSINEMIKDNIDNYNNEIISLEVFSQNLYDIYSNFPKLDIILNYIEKNYINEYSMCINILIDMGNENLNNLILNYLNEKSIVKINLIPGFIYRMNKRNSEEATKIIIKYEKNVDFKKELDFYFN